jgi:hypothetical protein
MTPAPFTLIDLNGRRVAYGRVDAGDLFALIEVEDNGAVTTMEPVGLIGDPFDVAGVDMCHVEVRPHRPRPVKVRSRRIRCATGGNCSSHGDGRSCGGRDCDANS